MTRTQVASRLFEAARLGTLRLPNRLVMAPMTRNRADDDGVPSPIMATYYAQRASAGLIVAEAATPNAVGQTYPNIPAIHNAGARGRMAAGHRCRTRARAAGSSSNWSTAAGSATPTPAG